MKLIDSSNIRPEPGTWQYRFCRWFNDNINWCEGVLYDKINPENPDFFLDKPRNPLYEWFYRFWLFPFKQNDCICCNTVRGLIYGAIVGFILGKLL